MGMWRGSAADGRPAGVRGRAQAAAAAVLWSLWALVRGNAPVDEAGSDSSEKAFMIILAIAAGTAVTAAAVAFIATKTALFQ